MVTYHIYQYIHHIDIKSYSNIIAIFRANSRSQEAAHIVGLPRERCKLQAAPGPRLRRVVASSRWDATGAEVTKVDDREQVLVNGFQWLE